MSSSSMVRGITDDQGPWRASVISLTYTDVIVLGENDIDGRVAPAGTIKLLGTYAKLLLSQSKNNIEKRIGFTLNSVSK